jgi:hypothetical protein
MHYISGVAEIALRKGNGCVGLRHVSDALMRRGQAPSRSYMDIVVFEHDMMSCGIVSAPLCSSSFEAAMRNVVGPQALLAARVKEIREWIANGVFRCVSCEACSFAAGPCDTCCAVVGSGGCVLPWSVGLVSPPRSSILLTEIDCVRWRRPMEFISGGKLVLDDPGKRNGNAAAMISDRVSRSGSPALAQ